MKYGKITGYGKALPKRIITNEEISNMVDTTDEWIAERTGIRQRHVVSEGEHCSTLSTEAGKKALEKAGVDAKDVDLIIVATSSPDFLTPPVSSMIQHMLGAENAGAFTTVVGCTGFVTSLIQADQFIRTGAYQNILVIGVEVITRQIDWEDRNTCVLFGDGAAAVLVQAVDQECGVLSHIMGSDGSMFKSIIHPSGGTAIPASHETIESRDVYLKMNGREVFKFASGIIPKTMQQLLVKSGNTLDDIAMFIPHQANARIIEYAVKQMGLPQDKVYVNVQNYGNTSAGSVPIAFSEVMDQGKLKDGDLVAMIAFGAGLTWAGALVQL